MKQFQKLCDALGIGKRIFTFHDFERICYLHDIEIVYIPEKFSFWLNTNGKSVIVLHNALNGYSKSFTAFHELAHHFLHAGKPPTDAIATFDSNNSAAEIEADEFALMAVCPEFALAEHELAGQSDACLREIASAARRFYVKGSGHVEKIRCNLLEE